MASTPLPISSEAANRRTVEHILQAFSEGRVDEYLAALHPDVVEEYPQSGERFVGRESLRAMGHAFPTYPALTINRLHSGGNLVVVEGSADYGEGGVYPTVFIYEFHDGLIVHEYAYWPQAFPAPEWRARFTSPSTQSHQSPP